MISNWLVVCHGNICRSPFAAAIMQSHFPNVKSAGFVNPGKSAAKKVRDYATQKGYDLSQHRSQVIDDQLIEWAEIIIYMDNGNYRRLLKLGCELPYIAVLGLGEWAIPPVARIPDPMFMAKDSLEFKETMELIEQATLNLIADGNNK